MRLRILFGTILLVGLLAAYGLVVAALAAHLLPPSRLAAFLFYAAAESCGWHRRRGWCAGCSLPPPTARRRSPKRRALSPRLALPDGFG